MRQGKTAMDGVLSMLADGRASGYGCRLPDPDNSSPVGTHSGHSPTSRFAVVSLPPSVNRAWRSLVIKGRVRVVKSAEYKKWFKDNFAKVEAMGKVKTPAGIELTITGCRKSRDLSNFEKAVGDLLQHAGVIKNDNVNHVRKLSMLYAGDGEPSLQIEVWTL